jgi:hypothetical protein
VQQSCTNCSHCSVLSCFSQREFGLVARFSTQVCASLHRSVLVGRAGVVLPGGSARQQAERLLPVASIPPRFVRADAQH